MLQFSRWKITLILLVSFLGIVYALPNLFPEKTLERWQKLAPGWLPQKTVSLGLDLQGGAHLLYTVNVEDALRDKLENMRRAARQSLREKDVAFAELSTTERGLQLRVADPEKVPDARAILRKLEEGFEVDVVGEALLVGTLNSDAFDRFASRVIAQSIEVVRRRVDETGTREPVIQRQGESRILVQLPGVDNPEAIKDLIGTTAQLSFHLVARDAPMDKRAGATWKRLSFEQNPAQDVAVQRRAIITGDMLTNAQTAFQQGQPVVSFRFDTLGARRFCEVTSDNVGRPFAIVLDEKVISAPVIQDSICGGSGIITGGFTVKEAADLALLLRAGALPAELQIAEERTVGPSLGADSVEAGKQAAVIALMAVLIFMGLMYGLFGLYANIALLINISLIFALLSALQATLTLPGIAGIVLTVGMAVDANVLIFERIREETRRGRTPISAVDSGYSQAMSTIVDANLTTLIAAILLYSFGTGPIKGFAVTLAIGILTSLFSAILLTRLIIAIWLKTRKPAALAI